MCGGLNGGESGLRWSLLVVALSWLVLDLYWLVWALTRVRVRVRRECPVRRGRWLGWMSAICAGVSMRACDRPAMAGCVSWPLRDRGGLPASALRWPVRWWVSCLARQSLEFRFCDLVKSSRVRARD